LVLSTKFSYIYCLFFYVGVDLFFIPSYNHGCDEAMRENIRDLGNSILLGIDGGFLGKVLLKNKCMEA
jgi:hypothetical protein